MGIPEYEAKRYEGAVKDGGNNCSQFTATLPRRSPRAKDALKNTGAHDVSSSGEAGSRDIKGEGGRSTYGRPSGGTTMP